mmetsp:Transcript_7923/g.15041  ORF Transcript_7923/g.15041 Transcript_7923/m.15041 type:complete len:340 (+) Transcript_7923:676-1695(+)
MSVLVSRNTALMHIHGRLVSSVVFIIGFLVHLCIVLQFYVLFQALFILLPLVLFEVQAPLHGHLAPPLQVQRCRRRLHENAPGLGHVPVRARQLALVGDDGIGVGARELGRGFEVRDLPALPVLQHHLGRCVDVGLAPFQQLAAESSHLLQEVIYGFPGLDAVGARKVVRLDARQHRRNGLRGVVQVADAYYPLEHHAGIRVRVLKIHHPRAVNQVDLLGQGDVLPDLGLARHGRHLAHLLRAQRVDDRRLPNIGVAHKPHRDASLVTRLQARQLAKHREQCPFAKGACLAGVEGKSGVSPGEGVQPPLGDPGRDEVTLVQQQDEMLLPVVLPQMLLQV